MPLKILYVILTCEKYLNTRIKWQEQAWAKNAPRVYLSKPVGEEIYNNAPLKYVDLFWNISNIEIDYYDWFFFCDDDTFVFTDRLEKFLPQANMHTVMIGFKGGTFPIYNLNIKWCSGGAGIALNKVAVKAIQEHLRATPRPIVTHETDISLAIWATMATQDLTVIDSKRFSPFNPFDAEREGLKDCITYHYCTENDFIRLGREL